MSELNTYNRILAVLEILQDKTDENHRIHAGEILDIMEERYGARCDRRTIYAIIRSLQDYGIEVKKYGAGGEAGYFLTDRVFDFPELKLMVDAVQSSKFIPEAEARDLIRKLESLCSSYQAKQLAGQVTIINRPRAGSEEAYSQVELLHDAIYEGKKIKFQYTAWSSKKERVLKHGGRFYLASPLSLVYDAEMYYLVAYDEDAGKVKHFRVDKIVNLTKEEERAQIQSFDAAAFARKTFEMYGGEDVQVVLRGREELVGACIDHFGTELFVHPDGPGFFQASALISVSPTFFGWVLGLGEGIEIQRPQRVREAFQDYIKRVLSLYEEKRTAGEKKTSEE